MRGCVGEIMHTMALILEVVFLFFNFFLLVRGKTALSNDELFS